MTVQEVFQKAVEGGYHVKSLDSIATYYKGANDEWSVWTRKDTESSFMIPVEETFLDTSFWQALGRALGWRVCVHGCGEKSPNFCGSNTRHQEEWLSYWHRFIDHLATGKDPASFFESIVAPKVHRAGA